MLLRVCVIIAVLTLGLSAIIFIAGFKQRTGIAAADTAPTAPVGVDTTDTIDATFSGTLGPRYTMRERFGFGFDQNVGSTSSRSIDEFSTRASLGASWYLDWGSGLDNDSGGPKPGLEYFPMVGAWSRYNAPSATDSGLCQQYKSQVQSKPEKYPDGTNWIIGNEIGWNDVDNAGNARSANDYANEFVKWKACIKSINPTFRVGSGAIISTRAQLPAKNYSLTCLATSDPKSGLSYFKSYISKIHSIDPTMMPDFYTNHAYTPCDGWTSIPAFKQAIVDYRKAMYDLGVKGKDLIITEFGPLYPKDLSLANIESYMTQATAFMVTAKNTTGPGRDQNRLVQRWAWFEFNAWKNPKAGNLGNVFPNLQLFDTNSTAIKPLGKYYNSLIDKYAPSL